MLHIITTLHDSLAYLVKDDPVRPEIPLQARVSENSEIFVWLESGEPGAVVCVKYTQAIPSAVSELDLIKEATVATFYTIWSYKKGCGQTLIRNAQQHIAENKPYIKRFVTLSPKTEMARAFHHKNGAFTLRENPDTVNYEYC